MGTEPVDYCREIETYLCRKNDGHLIRVVGPSFARVSGWEQQGIPLKVAFAGIDRYFDRYYRQGPRRRPVKIDFCEADVLDVFDEWKRAVGLVGTRPYSAIADTQATQSGQQSPGGIRQATRVERVSGRRGPSLPEHLERVITRLTSLRAGGALGDACDPVIDAVSRELDIARASRSVVRGAARLSLAERLAELDQQLLALVRESLSADITSGLHREADDELAPFRAGMAAEEHARARDAAFNRLVREREGLPVIAFLEITEGTEKEK